MAGAVLVIAFGSMAASILVALRRSGVALRAGPAGAATTSPRLRELVPVSSGRVHFGHLWEPAGVLAASGQAVALRRAG